MKLSEKITAQRKAHGLSQEELADRLGVSRQAVSRGEQGSALPDANNLVQLSRTFGVTTDYLLHDDYENDQDLPPVRENQETHFRQLFATSGSPPQNTQTGLLTQIVFFRHLCLQDLRQGRCGVCVGELPSIVRQEFGTQRSIRLPCKGRRRAIVLFQA